MPRGGYGSKGSGALKLGFRLDVLFDTYRCLLFSFVHVDGCLCARHIRADDASNSARRGSYTQFYQMSDGKVVETDGKGDILPFSQQTQVGALDEVEERLQLRRGAWRLQGGLHVSNFRWVDPTGCQLDESRCVLDASGVVSVALHACVPCAPVQAPCA